MDRMKFLPLLLALAGCALVPAAGEDAAGVEARANTKPVLAALVAYQKARGEYPSSLHELVPKFLAEVPFSPGLYYDRATKVVQFSYFPSWPQQESVGCSAKLGDLDWTCAK